MHISLLRSLTLKVKGLSICLLVSLAFTASALAQTQLPTDTVPGTIVAESESAVPAGHAAEKQPVAQQPNKDLKHWGLSVHAGVSIPHGDFSNVFNPGPNVAFDLEYRINHTFSVEGIYGFHRFRGEQFGAFRLADLNLHQFSVNGKVYGSSSPTRPFFNFGGGAYVFTPGASTHGGLNVGVGVQHDINPSIAVEGVYNFHNVFTSGSSTQFSTVQGGVRFRF
jgi:opacity protein-like surface antigen